MNPIPRTQTLSGQPNVLAPQRLIAGQTLITGNPLIPKRNPSLNEILSYGLNPFENTGPYGPYSGGGKMTFVFPKQGDFKKKVIKAMKPLDAAKKIFKSLKDVTKLTFCISCKENGKKYKYSASLKDGKLNIKSRKN
jgi:hypothetical protein